MPVIACPDCGREVSTLAPVCPHCGRPSPAGMSVPQAAPAAAAQEETLWRGTPSPIVLTMKVVVLALILIGVPLLGYAFDKLQGSLVVTAVLALAQIAAILYSYLRLRATLYTITNQRVIVERGLLSKSLSEIDLRTIDDTQFFQTLVDRMLGIGNVILISSDKAAPMFMLRAIKDPRGVRETIRANAYQVSQRQLFTRAT